MSTYPNVIEFHNNLINIIYPVGSIYMSVNNVSPATFLGGTWEQIQDTFLWCAGSKHAAGTTGGEETHTLSIQEAPQHTHTRGTMEIHGGFGCVVPNNHGNYVKGSFVASQMGAGNILGGTVYAQNPIWSYDFWASRNWSGETSSRGGNQPHNNMPPYLAVYVWKRTA